MLLNLTCPACGDRFIVDTAEYRRLGIPGMPKRCPKCCDEAQGRPSVATDRKEHFSIVCRVKSLPGEWQPVENAEGDRYACKIDVKGSTFGKSWHGRIVIFSVDLIAPQVGDVAVLRDMEVLHRIRRVEHTRQTLHHGAVTVYRDVPLDSDEGEVITSSRRYIRLDKVEEEPGDNAHLPNLVWVTAYSKTTLKGFGRQFHRRVEGAPLWEKRICGGYRSGRASTTGVLAVVDADHALRVIKSEGGMEDVEAILT